MEHFKSLLTYVSLRFNVSRLIPTVDKIIFLVFILTLYTCKLVFSPNHLLWDWKSYNHWYISVENHLSRSCNFRLISAICLYAFLQGKISFKNLKRVAKELGENLTDEELQVWIAILFIQMCHTYFTLCLHGMYCQRQ